MPIDFAFRPLSTSLASPHVAATECFTLSVCKMPVVDGVRWVELHNVRAVFLTLHILGGLVGMPLLVATFLFAKNIHKRQPAFINFCISWILYSAVYVLLGHTGRPINSSMCYIQTAFVMAAPPMTGLSTTLVVFKIWWTFRTAQNTEYRSKPKWLKVLCQILFQIAYPGTFDERNGVYCTAYGVTQRRWIVPIFCVVCIVFMLVFQTLLIMHYFNNRRRLLRSFPLLTKGTSRNLVIRVGLFNFYLVVSFGMGIEFIRGGSSAWPYMIQAGLPLVGFLCFGTQRDVLRTWKIWNGRRSATHPSSSGNGNGSSNAAFARRPTVEYPMDVYQPNVIHLSNTHDSDDQIEKNYPRDGATCSSDIEGSHTGNNPNSESIPVSQPRPTYHVMDIRR